MKVRAGWNVLQQDEKEEAHSFVLRRLLGPFYSSDSVLQDSNCVESDYNKGSQTLELEDDDPKLSQFKQKCNISSDK